MSEAAMLLLELYRRHMYALRDGDTAKRKRLFDLIEDFEWAFPAAAKEVADRYPVEAK